MAGTLVARGLLDSPIGRIVVEAGREGLQRIVIAGCETPHSAVMDYVVHQSDPGRGVAFAACRQLAEYFRGARQVFDLPLDMTGMTPFARQVLSALQAVPYGTTVSYSQLAHRIDRPHSARAVGRVMAFNPLPIVLPCHRVVGAAGQLVGYSSGGGVQTKRWLIDFEKRAD